ncbi:hypothetical protein E2C01_101471 [Portunus trituberculatus]|uniref:Uncharacterized protein n=1 Tax=Portunus trituberculatus TaxID=210409 RepID=A0A5B7K9P4_PORTR|nr:hypothetical protein [Portunus trituberculatus]
MDVCGSSTDGIVCKTRVPPRLRPHHLLQDETLVADDDPRRDVVCQRGVLWEAVKETVKEVV